MTRAHSVLFVAIVLATWLAIVAVAGEDGLPSATELGKRIDNARKGGLSRYAGIIKKGKNVLNHARVAKHGPAKAVRKAIGDAIGTTRRGFRGQAVDPNLGANISCLTNPAIMSAMEKVQSECMEDVDALLGIGSWKQFCHSSCLRSAKTHLEPHRECLASNGGASLYHLIYTCEALPQCLSGKYLDDLKAFHSVCEDGLTAVFDMNDGSAAAKISAQTFCRAGCDQKLVSLLKAHPECTFSFGDVISQPRIDAVVNLLPQLCSRSSSDSDVCAVELKGLAGMDCSRKEDCGAPGSWCDADCQPIYPETRLVTACGKCTMGIQSFIGDLLDGMAAPSFIKLMCLRGGVSGNGYCMSALPKLLDQALNLSAVPSTDDALKALCDAPQGRQCVEEALTVAGQLVQEGADELFERCADGKNGDYDRIAKDCNPQMSDGYDAAYQMRKYAQVLCSSNAKGQLCVPKVNQLLADAACAKNNAACTRECQSAFASSLENAGCCASEINTYSRAASSPATKVPVTRTTFSMNQKRAQVRTTMVTVGTYVEGDRSTSFANSFASCAGNTSAYWAAFDNPCAYSSQAKQATIQRAFRPLKRALLEVQVEAQHSAANSWSTSATWALCSVLTFVTLASLWFV